MSLKQKVTIGLAVVSILIAALLSIITAYLPTLSPPVETWVTEHIIGFWVTIGVLVLLAMILGGIATYIQIIDPGNATHSSNELNDITNKVDKAADIASQDPMLKSQSDRFK